MHIVQDIDGVTMARGVASADTIRLSLVAPSGFAEGGNGGFFPAESLTFDSINGIRSLGNLCLELVAAHEEATGVAQ